MGLLKNIFIVPVVMVLAIAGTVILVKLIQWLIHLVFRDKGRKLVDDFTDWTLHVDEHTKNLLEV